MAKMEPVRTMDSISIMEETIDIKSLIYIVRGQVMLDSDLAMLYQVE